uniref:Uncharacterized protein n=1 Tax=Fagus sylvatica TaxID=28930 RepID=A0A2N9GW03_FAGSY
MFNRGAQRRVSRLAVEVDSNWSHPSRIERMPKSIYIGSVRSGSGLVRSGGPVRSGSGPVQGWSGSADAAGQKRARRVLACAWRALACAGVRWHTLRHVSGAWEGRRSCHRRVAARGGSGETILHAVLQIGRRGTLWWYPLLDSMLGGAGF